MMIKEQTFDGTETYPYGTNDFKVCESEMLMVKDLLFEIVIPLPIPQQQ